MPLAFEIFEGNRADVTTTEEMREVRSFDVVLPARDKTIRLRVVSTPSKELKVLLQRLKVLLPNRPKIIEKAANVVQKTASSQA